MSVRIASLLTCHNRRDKTLMCLRALWQQQADGAVVQPFILDAGSTDGTAEAIASEFPDVTLIRGTSDMYWNRGMHAAFSRAVALGFDYYLWLNDDTVLDPGALSALLDTGRAVGVPGIVVGSTRDPLSGSLTYGGVWRPTPRLRPLRFELLDPVDEPRQCETMNGNCVLIPHGVVERIGVLDPVFSHHMGDYDFGLRARRAGFSIWMVPGTLGTCARNKPPNRQGLREDAHMLRGPKGLPWSEWKTFARRWATPWWPLFAISPYVRWGVHQIRR